MGRVIKVLSVMSKSKIAIKTRRIILLLSSWPARGLFPAKRAISSKSGTSRLKA
jgi:hypothetical protein